MYRHDLKSYVIAFGIFKASILSDGGAATTPDTISKFYSAIYFGRCN